MSWLDEVELEMVRAAEAQRSGNQGKARTSARRAVGIAIGELQRRFPGKHYGSDFMSQLRSLALDPSVPQNVHEAADRLQTRLSPGFESPAKEPLEDARIIVNFVLDRMR